MYAVDIEITHLYISLSTPLVRWAFYVLIRPFTLFILVNMTHLHCSISAASAPSDCSIQVTCLLWKYTRRAFRLPLCIAIAFFIPC